MDTRVQKIKPLLVFIEDFLYMCVTEVEIVAVPFLPVERPITIKGEMFEIDPETGETINKGPHWVQLSVEVAGIYDET